MNQPAKSPPIPLPKQWTQPIKSAILQVISLAAFSVRNATGHAIENLPAHPLEIRIHQLEQQICFLKVQSRIKDQRMSRIAASRRPVYTGEERFEILQLKAAQNGSLREIAKQFLVAPVTNSHSTSNTIEAANICRSSS